MGEGLLQLFHARDLAVEIPLHQVIVGHDDPLDQGVVDGMLPAAHVLGHRAGRRATPVVGDGGVRQQVGHAPKARLLADRQLQGGDPRAEGPLQVLERSLERGPLPVELVHEDQPGQPQAGGDLPHVGGLHLHALDGADHEDRQVGDGQGGGRLLGEIGVAGAVEQVDLVALPLHGRQGGRDGQASLVLLGLEIGDRGRILDPPGPADGP